MPDSQDGLAEPQGLGVLAIIMVTIIMMIFLVVVFIFFLYLYAKWRRLRTEQTATGSRRRRRLVFAANQDPRGQRRGLDPEILSSLPVLIFQQEEFKDGLECAVCLSELVQGEKTRLLPKCNHGFHAGCIDMWFQSHSTCPICRNPVASESSKRSTNSGVEENASENNSQSSNSDVSSSVSPVYGNQPQACSIGAPSEEKRPSLQPPCSSSCTSSSSAGTSGNKDHGMLMIDVPSEINPSSSLPSSSRFAEDELISPMMTSLKSFKRLLSWNKRSGPFSPGSLDVEQAGKAEN